MVPQMIDTKLMTRETYTLYGIEGDFGNKDGKLTFTEKVRQTAAFGADGLGCRSSWRRGEERDLPCLELSRRRGGGWSRVLEGDELKIVSRLCFDYESHRDGSSQSLVSLFACGLLLNTAIPACIAARSVYQVHGS